MMGRANWDRASVVSTQTYGGFCYMSAQYFFHGISENTPIQIY